MRTIEPVSREPPDDRGHRGGVHLEPLAHLAERQRAAGGEDQQHQRLVAREGQPVRLEDRVEPADHQLLDAHQRGHRVHRRHAVPARAPTAAPPRRSGRTAAARVRWHALSIGGGPSDLGPHAGRAHRRPRPQAARPSRAGVASPRTACRSVRRALLDRTPRDPQGDRQHDDHHDRPSTPPITSQRRLKSTAGSNSPIAPMSSEGSTSSSEATAASGAADDGHAEQGDVLGDDGAAQVAAAYADHPQRRHLVGAPAQLHARPARAHPNAAPAAPRHQHGMRAARLSVRGRSSDARARTSLRIEAGVSAASSLRGARRPRRLVAVTRGNAAVRSGRAPLLPDQGQRLGAAGQLPSASGPRSRAPTTVSSPTGPASSTGRTTQSPDADSSRSSAAA